MRGWDWQTQTSTQRMDEQQDPSEQHRELYKYPLMSHDGKKHEKDVPIGLTEPLCCTAEVNAMVSINHIAGEKKR